MACSLLLTGCATSFPRGSTQLAAQRAPAESIRWPAAYDPAKAAFFVHNQIDIQAPPAVVWDILVHVEDWPHWYAGATDLTFIPEKLHGLHQAFLEELKRKAETRIASPSATSTAP